MPENNVVCWFIKTAVDEQQQDAARSKIMQYPFDAVRFRLYKEGRIPSEQVETAIDEFRKFLIVMLYVDGSVSMIAWIVDEVWHAFILHTRDYADFCDDVFGKFIHHYPNWPGAPLKPGGNVRFISTYIALFGELHPVWKMLNDEHDA